MNTQNVSVLCVTPKSFYKQLPNVRCFDADDDCRTFTCNTPIVCHPPCRLWSRFTRHQAKPRTHEKHLAILCVEFLRICGGVLEHPAHSHLWEHCKLPLPGHRNEFFECIQVDQHWFGYPTPKKTWLLLSRHPNDIEIPFSLRQPSKDWTQLSKHERMATTPKMAHFLVDIARRCK